MVGVRTVRGYHGTLDVHADQIAREGFQSSRRKGLWLGNGVYFFEEAPMHALRWAQQISIRRAGNPAVFEVELDLSECMDLTDGLHWPLIESVWTQYSASFKGEQLSIRALVDEEYAKTGIVGKNIIDGQLMNLAVALHQEMLEAQGKRITTVRGAFVEGQPIFPNSWLFRESHVIVVAIDPEAILRPWRQIY
jgi:hypothetical protein